MMIEDGGFNEDNSDFEEFWLQITKNEKIYVYDEQEERIKIYHDVEFSAQDAVWLDYKHRRREKLKRDRREAEKQNASHLYPSKSKKLNKPRLFTDTKNETSRSLVWASCPVAYYRPSSSHDASGRFPFNSKKKIS